MARLKAVVDECLLVAQAFTEINSDTYNEIGAVDFEDNDKQYPFFLFDKRSIDGTVESFTRESLPKATNYSQKFYFFNTYTEGEKPSTDLQTKEDALKEIADKYFAELRVRNQSGENGFFLVGRPTFNVVDETHNERLIQISYTLEIQTLPDNCELGTFVYSGLDKPTTLVATAISGAQIDLSWVDNATTETNYEVFRSDDCVNYTLINTIAANSNSYSDTTVVSNTSYMYKVRAINTLANGEFSNIAIACASGGGITPSGVLYKRVNFTAMTTSYRTGDDAYNRINNPFSVRPVNPLYAAELDYTSVTPFLTLLENNAFGTKERFTNSLGLTATYDGTGGELIDYVIDHLTGLAWIITQQSGVLWDVAIDTPLSTTYVGFTDFKLPNIDQQLSIYNYAVRLNYAPFNISSGWFLWSSTTRFDFTANANYLDHTGRVRNADKTGFSFSFMVCRNHY